MLGIDFCRLLWGGLFAREELPLLADEGDSDSPEKLSDSDKPLEELLV